MIPLPQKVTSVTHPMIEDMYLTLDYSNFDTVKRVLIVNIYGSASNPVNMFDFYNNLDELRNLAQKEVGYFHSMNIHIQ